MAEINDLKITDASNTARFPEAMAPSAVNDGARALEGLVARWHENINTSIATTGSANAYVLAAKGTQVLFDGLVIGFDANFVNTGSATINVDSTGVKTIKKHNDQNLAAGDIEANQKVIVIYDGTSWQMVSPLGNAPGTLSNVVEDVTPQLGGFLDTNSKFISHAQGAAIASVAGDTDIFANFDGNTVHITGTNAITDFGTPKSAGDSMWVIFDAAASVVDSATITVAGNTNYQAAANDLALVYALTTSTFLFMPFPNSGGSPVAAGGGLTSVQNFTSSGTWTKPAGITKVRAQLVGGGGGGGNHSAGASNAAAGGGGAGGFAEEFIDVSGTSSETVTVGAAGAGGASSGSTGSTGGTTSFGSLLSATGGSGGVGVSSSTDGKGGDGGVGSGGDINANGGAGGAGPDSAFTGGCGGNSHYQGGGAAIVNATTTSTTGSVGTLGGGGAAGQQAGGSGDSDGGAGGAGIVIVWEYV
jgi:hypothetical protein